MTNISQDILNFLHVSEQLKHEFRHSWTSKGWQESVAEHSWRVALMLILCSPYLEKSFDLLKALKMTILHDLPEAKIGDQHYLDVNKNENTKRMRSQMERQAIASMGKILQENGEQIVNLWNEFEDECSAESKVVKFLDKLEVYIQHNEADISTWTKKEIDSTEKYFDDLKIDDTFLLSLKEVVKSETMRKIKTEKISPSFL